MRIYIHSDAKNIGQNSRGDSVYHNKNFLLQNAGLKQKYKSDGGGLKMKVNK